MRDRGLAIFVAAALLGAPGAVWAAPKASPKSSKKTAKKNAKKKTPPITANAGQWHRYQGRLVKRIDIWGVKRTRVWRIRHWLDTKVGQPFDAETLGHDLRRIRNLQLFRPVIGRVDPEGRGVVIRIYLQDKWSLLPYFNMFFNLGSVFAITGIYDVNTLGFLSYVDLQLMLFSYLPVTTKSIRPGFKLVVQIPRLGRLPLSYYVIGRAQASLRTIIGGLDREAFALMTWGSFLTEQYGGYHSLTWEPFQWLRVGVSQTLRYDHYRVARDTEPPVVPTPEGGLTHAFGVSASLGYTRYRDYMQHGLVLNLYFEGASRHFGSVSEHARVSAVARAYYDFGPVWGNLVGRLGAGYMKGGTFSNLFALGSWTGLRGFFTAQFTARSYVYGNIEYRTGLWRMGFPIASIIPYFRGKIFQIQGAVFADLGAVAGGGPYRTDEHGRPLVSIGAGLRVAVINLYKAILRIDFAYTLSPYNSYDLIIATQQYF